MSDTTYSGFFYQVRCFNQFSFGYDVAGSAQSIFVLCVAGDNSWGGYSGAGSAPGKYYYCQAGAGSFGRTASGSFYYCRAVSDTFGPDGFSGNAYFCESEGTGFGSGGTMSGTLINCYAASFSGGISGTILNSTIGGISYSQSGLSTTIVRQGGTLKVDTTTTGNVLGGEDNLNTYSVPGATLAVNGQYLDFDCAGTFNNSTHNKQLKVYFGATAIFDSGTLTGTTLGASDWRAHGKIIRTSATAQKCTTEFTITGALLGAVTTTTTKYSTAAETLSSASTFKCTGTDLDGAPASNEVIQQIEVLKWFPQGN